MDTPKTVIRYRCSKGHEWTESCMPDAAAFRIQWPGQKPESLCPLCFMQHLRHVCGVVTEEDVEQ
jgi:hypothetical protein